MKRKYEIDMIRGPLLGKILLFAIPLVCSSILQLLFNAADVVVVGRFAGARSLAAVGSTTSIISLLISTFQGLSMGTNVLAARYFAAVDEDRMKKLIQTSALTAIVSGLLLAGIGAVGADVILKAMASPDEVRPLACLYMRIYFAGMPIIMLYNFGAAILMGVGDTRRPLFYLMGSGAANVLMNLFFVIVLKLGVAGVALATVLSQAIAAFLVYRCLIRAEGIYRLVLKGIRFDWRTFGNMVRIGLPAGMESAVFGISNTLIQSSVNSFGATFMAGCAAAQSLEGFVFVGMNAIYQTCLSFTSANFGAHRFDRMKTVALQCTAVVSVIGLSMGLGANLFGRTLLGIYTSDQEAIRHGLLRLKYICGPYALCGVMDVLCAAIRGMGISIAPTVISLAGACGLRIIWINTVFRRIHSPGVLFVIYPITWIVTTGIYLIALRHYRKKLMKNVFGTN